MARQILIKDLPRQSSQKDGRNVFTCISQTYEHSIQLSRSPRSHSTTYPRPLQLAHDPSVTMTIEISPTLRQWLIDHGLTGYIHIIEAQPHPNTQDIGAKLNIDTITNAMV